MQIVIAQNDSGATVFGQLFDAAKRRQGLRTAIDEIPDEQQATVFREFCQKTVQAFQAPLKVSDGVSAFDMLAHKRLQLKGCAERYCRGNLCSEKISEAFWSDDMKPVRKVVFPVAGLGTRFLPATKAMPKEMLPVVDKPLIQYAVEEAAAAGVTDMIFITGRYKRAIEDHFDKSPELEADLLHKEKMELLDLVHSITPRGVNFIYIRQPEPLGLGHAVMCAQPVVGDEPFGVILADDLIYSQQPAMGQLIEVREKAGGGNVLAVQNVAPLETKKYGIVGVKEDLGTTSLVNAIVEKPDPQDAPSTMAVIGRYVLEPEVFEALRHVQRGVGGEIQLTDAISACLTTTPTYAHRFDGIRFDCGNKQGFLSATAHYARLAGYEF